MAESTRGAAARGRLWAGKTVNTRRKACAGAKQMQVGTGTVRVALRLALVMADREAGAVARRVFSQCGTHTVPVVPASANVTEPEHATGSS